MATMIKRLFERWRVWVGSLYIVQYSCNFCDYGGTIPMSNMEYHFLGPEKVIRCPKCGFKTLWRRGLA